MRIVVLSASALLALLRNELGADLVDDFLADEDTICFAHVVNFCEAFYDLHRAGGEEAAQMAVRDLLAAHVVPRDDIDEEFWQAVGRLKSAPPRKSLADCFEIALAQRLDAELVTADHHEFDAIVPLGVCPIVFFR